VAVGIALLTKNAYIPFVVFTGLFMIDRRFFVSSILITPIIETVLIVAEGITLTKLQAIFFIFIFYLLILLDSYSAGSIYSDRTRKRLMESA